MRDEEAEDIHVGKSIRLTELMCSGTLVKLGLRDVADVGGIFVAFKKISGACKRYMDTLREPR